MIRCLIIDDEPLAVVQMEKYVERTPFMECAGTCCSAAEAIELLGREQVDVMFLDINMPDVNGLQLVRSLSRPPMVVFTTAYSEYALEGFKVDAVDYLLKPICFEDFLKAANKVKELIDLREMAMARHEALHAVAAETKEMRDSLFVKSDYRILRIPISSIVYVEGQAKPVISLLSMKKVEDALPQDSFMRVHRSYIVNLGKIKEVAKMRIVYDGDVYVPIGEMYKDAFFDYIDKYFIGKGR